MRSSSCLIAGRENLSRYPISPSSLFLLFSSFCGIPICLPKCVRPSPSPPRRVATLPDHLSREILALPSQFTLSLLQLAATSPTRPWMPLHTPPFLPSLPFSYPRYSARNTFLKGSDLTRYDGDVCRKPTAGLSGGSLSVRCRSADPISNWVRSVSKYRTDYVPL